MKGSAAHQKAEFAARPGAVLGAVILDVIMVAGAICYFWEVSTDQKTWTELTPTKGSRGLATGLLSGTDYCFRFRVLLKEGYTAWSTRPLPYHTK